MKSYNRMKSMLAVIASIAITTLMMLGCTTTADYTLGDEFAPTNQQMTMRHRLYKNGILTEENMPDAPCRVFETRLFKTDSVTSTTLGTFYLGLQRHERFGVRKLGFASQILHMVSLDDSTGFGYRPIYDSTCFVFELDTFVGDSTRPIQYNVYLLTGDLVDWEKKDTTFYVSYDPRELGHLEADAKPIYTFKFPDQENGVYTTSTKFRMQDTPYTKELVEKLYCMDKLDENGLANNNASLYQSDSAFIRTYKGVWIEPAADTPEGEGHVMAFSDQTSGIQVMGRSRKGGADADLIADTIDIVYYFNDTYAEGFGNVSAQSAKYNFKGTELEGLPILETEANRAEVDMAYVDGCGGIVTELTFTDEFLLSLYNISSGDKDYVSAAINQAVLRFYLDGSDYDYNKIDPLPMTDVMNQSIQRLGMYTDFKTLNPIVDYLYTQESDGSLYYDGYLNRSRALYEMNISSYIQQLVNGLLELKPEADGSIDLSKLKTVRTVYLAPDAYNIYTINRSVIQGGKSEINPACIELDLTFTLVK